MKKLLFLLPVFSVMFLQAQIINPSFESVTNGKPDTYNIGFYSTYFIKDTAAPHTGTTAAYIKGFGGQSYTMQGAVLGVFTASMTRPVSMTGWYKCNIMAGDSLVFNPYVYQTTTSSAGAFSYTFATTSTSVYKQFTAPFNYNGFASPTIGTIYTGIYLSGDTKDSQNFYIPKTGTWAIIDDLDLVAPSTVGLKENAAGLSIERIYPQPASDMTFLVYTISENTSSTLTLLDVTGKNVKTFFEDEKQSPGRYKAELDLSALAPGIYFASLNSGGQTKISKIVKQ